MGRITALPRPRRPQQIPSHQRHPDRTGGPPRGTDRLNHEVEESHNDLVHHVPGLDLRNLHRQVGSMPSVARLRRRGGSPQGIADGRRCLEVRRRDGRHSLLCLSKNRVCGCNGGVDSSPGVSRCRGVACGGHRGCVRVFVCSRPSSECVEPDEGIPARRATQRRRELTVGAGVACVNFG